MFLHIYCLKIITCIKSNLCTTEYGLLRGRCFHLEVGLFAEHNEYIGSFVPYVLVLLFTKVGLSHVSAEVDHEAGLKLKA